MNENPSQKHSVIIKKYANRRLYNTSTSTYVTLEDLSAMVKEHIEFNVYDAKTGEDLTHSVLTQIIFEEEGKSGQKNLLPISFLRQLIGYYGDNMQWMVPKYLEHSMQLLADNQKQLNSYFQSTFGNMFPFGTAIEEMSKQNLAMFERAMSMFSPFGMIPSTGNETETTTPVAKTTPVVKETVKEKVESSRPTMTYSTCSVSGSPVTSIIRRPETTATHTATPMPNVQSVTAPPNADDMQQKIANLQRQLADLAKNRA